MKIADNMKWFFIHIPKTAGISIRETLKEFFSISPTFPMDSKTRRPIIKHIPEFSPYQIISGHVTYLEARQMFPGRKLFIFLRDPLDRCLPWYYYLKHVADSENPLYEVFKLSSLNSSTY
jgi:hypothetical protein